MQGFSRAAVADRDDVEACPIGLKTVQACSSGVPVVVYILALRRLEGFFHHTFVPLVGIQDAVVVVVDILHIGHAVAVAVPLQMHRRLAEAALVIADRVVEGLLVVCPLGHDDRQFAVMFQSHPGTGRQGDRLAGVDRDRCGAVPLVVDGGYMQGGLIAGIGVRIVLHDIHLNRFACLGGDRIGVRHRLLVDQGALQAHQLHAVLVVIESGGCGEAEIDLRAAEVGRGLDLHAHRLPVYRVGQRFAGRIPGHGDRMPLAVLQIGQSLDMGRRGA